MRGWAVGAHGTILATQNGGTTWQIQGNGTHENLISVQFLADGRRGWVVGDTVGWQRRTAVQRQDGLLASAMALHQQRFAEQPDQRHREYFQSIAEGMRIHGAEFSKQQDSWQ